MVASKQSALDKWKARSARDVELPSGTKATIRLTTAQDEIKKGGFSAPVLAMAKTLVTRGELDAEMLDEEQIESLAEYRKSMVARCIVAVEGTPVELTNDDVAQLPRDDVDRVWAYFTRTVSLPKAN